LVTGGEFSAPEAALDTRVFEHVPALSGRIVDPDQSFFRMTRSDIDEWDQLVAREGIVDWRFSHEVRDALRAETLRGRLHEDIWIFAYGSLMWDPAFHFEEVRYATLDGACRSFRLLDTIGRGSPKFPGLMAGLGHGNGCDGLAFRINAARCDAETDVLWMREMICPGYAARFHELRTPQGPVEGLAFWLDENCEQCLPTIALPDAAKLISQGKGPGGTSREYLEKLVRQLDTLGLADASMETLLSLVEASGGAVDA
jgi:cation transport protein ChaC